MASPHHAHPQLSDAPPPPPPPPTVRPALPDRDVTADTIEDAFVGFIFYCNPAIPLDTDTATLRDSFRNPPRSGGKSFNTFAVFELVKKFYDKEIRTWTELTTKLGVEPPDRSKDESTQKIAQYGVRLKKWMNSMHVKAFFEYLMNMSNDYWTKVPTDPNPIAQPVRDGVAVEDDMALRALLPQIRPKRGRKRPADEDAASTPAQRTHLSPHPAVDDFRQGTSGPWSAAPDGRGWPTDPLKEHHIWPGADSIHTPSARWPQSAITPTTRGSFWDDALEPRSAITPSRPRLSGQRRGPKNVSSAWRPGVPGNVKTRGRPPINRASLDGSGQISAGGPILGPGGTDSLYSDSIGNEPSPSGMSSGSTQYSQIAPISTSAPSQPFTSEGPRPSRPSISLQVPERPSGSVRLATPPPVVVINGDVDGDASTLHQEQPTSFPKGIDSTPGNMESSPHPKEIPGFYFEKVEDRTHVDEVLGFLTRALLAADWLNADGEISHPPSLEEATALVNTTVEDMWKTAVSPQAFLINLAAMAGGRILLVNEAKVCRLGEDYETGIARYTCEWAYGFGNIRGQYTMEQNVPISMLTSSGKSEPGDENKPLGPEDWKKKYEQTLADMHRKDKELLGLRTRVMGLLKSEKPKQ